MIPLVMVIINISKTCQSPNDILQSQQHVHLTIIVASCVVMTMEWKFVAVKEAIYLIMTTYHALVIIVL